MRTILALFLTATGLQAASIIPIPFAGTNTLTPLWWTTPDTNLTGIVPWKAWQAANTNFATLQDEIDAAARATTNWNSDEDAMRHNLTGLSSIIPADYDETGMAAMFTIRAGMGSDKTPLVMLNDVYGQFGFGNMTGLLLSEPYTGVPMFISTLTWDDGAPTNSRVVFYDPSNNDNLFDSSVDRLRDGTVTGSSVVMGMGGSGNPYVSVTNDTVNALGYRILPGLVILPVPLENAPALNNGEAWLTADSDGNPLLKRRDSDGNEHTNTFIGAPAGDQPAVATNSVLTSPVVTAFTTNSFISPFGTTNLLCTVTNFATLSYTNSAGHLALLYSTNNGVSWIIPPNNSRYIPPTLGPMKIAVSDWAHVQTVPPGLAIPSDVELDQVVVMVMTRTDLFNRTNQLFSQTLLLDQPLLPNQAANKAYVDQVMQATPWWSAPADVQINGYALNLSGTWAWKTFADTNTQTSALQFLSENVLVASQSNPVSASGASAVVDGTGTNVIVRVPTNGMPIAPKLEFSYMISPASWIWLTNTASVVGTNWSFTVAFPYPDMGFLIVATYPTNPPSITIPGLLALTPRTITTSTSSTWGKGAGLICCDSNYVYFSVQTNLWKRAALSTW